MSDINEEIPSMLRLLPMNKLEEWKDWEISDVQKYFLLEELAITRKGKYHYKSAGMKAEPGTVILFQFNNKVIGMADLIGIKKSDDPEYFDNATRFNNDPDYKGAYYFDPFSIRTFDPVSKEQMIRIWGDDFIDKGGKEHPAFERFNQTKQFLDPEKYPAFCKILRNVLEP
jgi:hypothetical protein